MRPVWWAACGVLIIVVLAAVLFPVFVHRSHPTLQGRCVSNLAAMGHATEMYMRSHGRHYPPAERWTGALRSVLTRPGESPASSDKSFICPSAAEESLPTYAMNSRLGGLPERDTDDSPDTVLYFESIPGRNLHGGPELFPPEPRHEDGYAICFVDGYVEFVSKSDIGELIWDPKPRNASTP